MLLLSWEPLLGSRRGRLKAKSRHGLHKHSQRGVALQIWTRIFMCRHFPCHRYKAAFQGQVPPYQAVAAFTGASLLVHAIEECACTDNRRIADVLERSKLGTVYGDVSFDENRQGTSPFLIVQHGEDLKLGVVTEKNIAMPTLEKKACIAEKRCKDKWTERPILGDCQDDGECTEGSGALYVLCSHAT